MRKEPYQHLKPVSTTSSNLSAEPKQAAVVSYAREASDAGVIHLAIDGLGTNHDLRWKIKIPREGETASSWLHQTLLDKY
jgi:hypothetical protein